MFLDFMTISLMTCGFLDMDAQNVYRLHLKCRTHVQRCDIANLLKTLHVFACGGCMRMCYLDALVENIMYVLVLSMCNDGQI